jgi:RimJ/RimL family protein N-acetyltransferase
VTELPRGGVHVRLRERVSTGGCRSECTEDRSLHEKASPQQPWGSLPNEHRILQGPVASYARFGFGQYLTLLQQDGIAIGICGLLRRDGRPDVEVGFALAPEFWSNGYAYESAAAVLAHARGALGLTRITAPQNLASISVLRKLGLQFEQKVRLEEHGAELELYASSA